MLRAAGLSRAFGGRVAVADVSFAVEPGEVVGFLGPNGAGKTTTMRMLAGLLSPDSGRSSAPERLGFLPEVFAGYDALPVDRYLRFMATMKSAAPAARPPAKVGS